jgi:hypothetical protein
MSYEHREFGVERFISPSSATAEALGTLLAGELRLLADIHQTASTKVEYVEGDDIALSIGFLQEMRAKAAAEPAQSNLLMVSAGSGGDLVQIRSADSAQHPDHAAAVTRAHEVIAYLPDDEAEWARSAVACAQMESMFLGLGEGEHLVQTSPHDVVERTRFLTDHRFNNGGLVSSNQVVGNASFLERNNAPLQAVTLVGPDQTNYQYYRLPDGSESLAITPGAPDPFGPPGEATIDLRDRLQLAAQGAPTEFAMQSFVGVLRSTLASGVRS